jgi:hypothetical protein
LWLDLAAGSGDAESVGERDKLASEMTASQLGEAHRLARAWKPKTAGQ